MGSMDSPRLYGVGGSVKPPFASSVPEREVSLSAVALEVSFADILVDSMFPLSADNVDWAWGARSKYFEVCRRMSPPVQQRISTLLVRRQLKAKGGFTEPPTAYNPGEPIVSIRDRLARIVHRELENMARGEIQEPSEQHSTMLHQPATFGISSSSASASDTYVAVPTKSIFISIQISMTTGTTFTSQFFPWGISSFFSSSELFHRSNISQGRYGLLGALP